MSTNKRILPLLGCSVVWGAFVVPVTSAVLQVALEAHRPSFALEFRAILPWVFVITALPATTLCFLGGMWLRSVGTATHRTRDLATHGLLTGAVLSLPYFIFGLIGTGKGSADDLLGFLLLTLLVGAIHGVAYALVFRRTLFAATA